MLLSIYASTAWFFVSLIPLLLPIDGHTVCMCVRNSTVYGVITGVYTLATSSLVAFPL